ncbi:MAG TPA: SAM-dependent methyltransferase, partial [Pyrinomonadaceae bacterium]|nr:SAM-dependent methyltransferase [Pyrinomonadaceae bacterium]
MSKEERLNEFLSLLTESISNEIFVKLSLGSYKGKDKMLKRLVVRLFKSKNTLKTTFQYKRLDRDYVQSFALPELKSQIIYEIDKGFHSAHLFTTEFDLQIDIGKRNIRINRSRPTFKERPELAHNKTKKGLLSSDSYFLKALGVTSDNGQVLSQSYSKWKQINKFIETVYSELDKTGLLQTEQIKVLDLGSGKAYLTFALYDFLRGVIGEERLDFVGIESREDLVASCNELAQAVDFTHLRFKQGLISDFNAEKSNLVIALHACDTATDDAIFYGISAGAELIVTSPCCHREIRNQYRKLNQNDPILKHAILLERSAETVTDALRGFILELFGYKVKMIEFVPTEHTPKNNLITARKISDKRPKQGILDDIRQKLETYNVGSMRLADKISEL